MTWLTEGNFVAPGRESTESKINDGTRGGDHCSWLGNISAQPTGQAEGAFLYIHVRGAGYYPRLY